MDELHGGAFAVGEDGPWKFGTEIDAIHFFVGLVVELLSLVVRPEAPVAAGVYPREDAAASPERPAT